MVGCFFGGLNAGDIEVNEKYDLNPLDTVSNEILSCIYLLANNLHQRNAAAPKFPYDAFLHRTTFDFNNVFIK